jgi:hypothetical protein
MQERTHLVLEVQAVGLSDMEGAGETRSGNANTPVTLCYSPMQ